MQTLLLQMSASGRHLLSEPGGSRVALLRIRRGNVARPIVQKILETGRGWLWGWQSFSKGPFLFNGLISHWRETFWDGNLLRRIHGIRFYTIFCSHPMCCDVGVKCLLLPFLPWVRSERSSLIQHMLYICTCVLCVHSLFPTLSLPGPQLGHASGWGERG